MRARVAAGVAVVVVAVGGLAADRVALHRDLDDARSASRALARQVAALEEGRRADAADAAKIDELEDRVRLLDEAAERVCRPTVVDAQRARLEGANAGSNYESNAYYTTLIGLLDTVCSP